MPVHYSVLYPTQAQMSDHLEIMCPEIFNYFCLGGDQLFFVKDKRNKSYQILSCGWHPLNYKPGVMEHYHLLYSSTHFRDARNAFIRYVKDILAFSPKLFEELPD